MGQERTRDRGPMSGFNLVRRSRNTRRSFSTRRSSSAIRWPLCALLKKNKVENRGARGPKEAGVQSRQAELENGQQQFGRDRGMRMHRRRLLATPCLREAPRDLVECRKVKMTRGMMDHGNGRQILREAPKPHAPLLP